MERRITGKTDWKVGWDDLGRARLQWVELEPDGDSDVTLDEVIENLGAAELTLEEDTQQSRPVGFDPYDHRPSWLEHRSGAQATGNKKPPAWTGPGATR